MSSDPQIGDEGVVDPAQPPPAEGLSPQQIDEVGTERKRMRAATAVFAAATAFSRVAGMARQVVVAALFGQAGAASAFTVAFQIPNLVRSLVADAALSAAFVPVFTELNERGERERAWRVASTVALGIVFLLGPLTILCMFAAPEIIKLLVDDTKLANGSIDLNLAVDLTRILMPIIVLMALSGLFVGILNAYDHFSTPALAPVAWNFVILAALLVIAPQVAEADRIYVYAIGVLVGTAVQVLIPLPWLRGRGGRFGLKLNWRDPKIREILLLMLPVTVSLGLINVQQIVDSSIATFVPAHRFPDGVSEAAGPAALENAFRIYMLPQGIFSVAVSTVLFPALARLAHRADMPGFRRTVDEGLRQIFLLLVPCAAVLIVLSEPVVRLLYERGEFTSGDTQITSAALAAFAVGLVFNGATLLLIRSFFSLKRPWLPTTIALLTLAVNVVGDLLLYRRYGVAGIAMATSIVNLVAFGTLYALLSRHVGLLGTARTARIVLGALVASGAAAWLGWIIWSLLDDQLGRSLLGQLASLGPALGVAGVLYLVVVIRLGLMDRATIAGMVWRRKAPDA